MYAVVEFASQESVASLLEGTSIPNGSHETMVPYKSRLLSLKNLGPADPKSSNHFQPQTTVPINELIQRLSGEESVSGSRFHR